MRLKLVAGIALAWLLSVPVLPHFQEQPEVVSAKGKKFYARADEKGAVAEAVKNLAANPANIDLMIALGQSQAGTWHFRDAISTYTAAIKIDPKNAVLYRHRGHRYITTRQLDKAIEDLERAAKLDETSYDILYHLGLAYYLKGKFDKAAEAYERCRRHAEGDDAIVAVSDWLYMSYKRAKDDFEASGVLQRIRIGMQVQENKAYYDRLLFYKGLKREAEIFNPKMGDLEAATVGYGLGNWYLCTGEESKAKEYFEKIVAGPYWPAFGFIAAETDLAKMK